MEVEVDRGTEVVVGAGAFDGDDDDADADVDCRGAATLSTSSSLIADTAPSSIIRTTLAKPSETTTTGTVTEGGVAGLSAVAELVVGSLMEVEVGSLVEGVGLLAGLEAVSAVALAPCAVRAFMR